MKARIIVGVLLAAGVGGAVIAANVAPRQAESRVPEHLRASRWENTYPGRLAREKVEEACGALPEGVYVDKAPGAKRPHLVGATEELTACAREKLRW